MTPRESTVVHREDAGVSLVERAEALLAAGELDAARATATAAAAAADRADDAVLLGRAALVMTGLWINDVRAPDARGQATGLQRRALARLPADSHSLRLRLRARIAATDAFYRGESDDELRAIVDEARRVGDPRALAEALSLLNHLLIGPDNADERLAIADEMIDVAAEADEPVLAVVGLCWRTIDRFLAGDPRAERALASLRSRDEIVGCRAVTYVRRVLETMVAIRSGRLADAEQMAEECLALGTSVGDADALAYYGGQLLLIRWLQGRDAELVPLFHELATAPTLDEVDYTFDAAFAALAARSGRLDLGAGLLDRLRQLDLAALPRQSTWTATLMGIIVAAAALDERELARQTYDLLAPYAHLSILPSFAVVDFGAADHFLGLAARCFGRLDDAAVHFERGIATDARNGNRPLVCIGRVELAETLLAMADDSRLARVVELYDAAIEAGDALDLVELSARWRARRDAVVGRSPSRVPELELHRRGDGWRLRFRGVDVVVADMVGLHHLQALLAEPGREIAAIVLAGGAGAMAAATSRQDVVDGQARDAYRRRARLLADQISVARERGASTEVGRLEAELEALVVELREVAYSGRTRQFSGPDERARTAVRKAIVRAIDAIASLDAVAGEHLRVSVVTGTRCIYRPPAVLGGYSPQ